MKLAYLSSSAIPSTSANSLQVMKMCQALTAEGATVVLYAPPAQTDTTRKELERDYGISMRFALRRIQTMALFGRRGLAMMAIRAARAEKCDVIYTRGVDFAWWSVAAGFPTLLELHQPPSGLLGPFFFDGFLRSPFGRLAMISDPLKENIRRAYPSLRDNSILIAPDAVDLERYARFPTAHEARSQLGLPPGDFTAGYFGSLVPGRGLDLIARLAERLPQITFMLCGGSPDQVDNRRESNRSANVHWMGHIPHADVPLHQAACDALLMPYERKVTVQGKGDTSDTMSPMKLYEYMASGRLILASDLPALRVILNSSNSVLLPPADVDCWAQALQSAVSDPHFGARLGARAKQDVSPFTWSNRARSILQFAFSE
jgi:glycosyltransferase involved in cell wall biosynthesis